MGKQNQPFVSICTPTFNRRPFIPAMIECFNHQTYPKEKMEWIIIDDGTDKIEDLVASIPNVKYFKYDTKMPLGKKRNLMHTKTKGDIIIYMDDDDYYPPERVSHAVNMLLTHPKALCAGASEIYIYFKHIQKMYQFGPYGPKHATAGTFAFKRELLKEHKYDDNASLAEEREFLKNYTVPFVQLEPKKTILVFSHTHNTFDKKTLLNNINPKYTKESDKKVEDFIKEKKLLNFFVNEIEDALVNYKPGEPSMKPDVLEQIKTLTASRNEIAKQGQLCREVNGKQELLTPEEIVTLLTQQENTIKVQQEILRKKDAYIKLLESKMSKSDDWTIVQDE
jgi:glycosyltransferase involved in cell wall biosynthesis